MRPRAVVAAVREADRDAVRHDGLPPDSSRPPTARAGRRSPSAASPAPTARWSARPASAPASTQRVGPRLASVDRPSGRWDSCFTLDFAQVAGGNFRPRVKDRYRQWLTHKFGTWWDQFGTSGCVGCGRCVTWCPVGIDVREELARHRCRAVPTPRPSDHRAAAFRRHRRSLAGPPRPCKRLPRGRPRPCRRVVATVRPETADTSRSVSRPTMPALLAGTPGPVRDGRACLASPLPPISVSRFRPDGIELTIRAAGPGDPSDHRASSAGRHARPRGPLGRGWPVERALGPRRGRSSPAASAWRRCGRCIDEILAPRDAFGAVRCLLRRADAGRPPVRRRARRLCAARDDIEVAHDRRPRRTRVARPRRRRHPALRPARLCDWRSDRRLRVRAGADDAGDRGRAARPRRPAGAHLRHARAPHGVRRRAVRPLPAGPVLRLPRRAGVLASPSSATPSVGRDCDACPAAPRSRDLAGHASASSSSPPATAAS